MMQLLALLCLMPVPDISDPRDERIKTFLNRDDDKMEAYELYLWNNPHRRVTLNDIMMVYKKQYNLDIAVNYTAFKNIHKTLPVNHPVNRVTSIDSVVPRGLALQLYLDSLPIDVTYVVENGTIWLVPGKASLPDHCKTCDLGTQLRTLKPKYEDQLNKEGSNRQDIPPTDLLNALYFFGSKKHGDFRVYLRTRNLPTSVANLRIKVPAHADLTYDAILKNILDQVNAKYIVYGDHSIVVVPK